MLHRLSHRSEVLVGTAIANRRRTEIQGLIGFFVNTIVMRADFHEDLTFRRLLQQGNEWSQGAYAHQDLPFEKLVEELQPERTLTQTPIFQVAFAFQNVPMPGWDLAGLHISQLKVDRGSSMFDLTLDLEETPGGLKGWFEYSSDLFEEPTIARYASHFETLLRGCVEDPVRRVSDLPLMSEVELQQVLQRGRASATSVTRPPQCLHDLFSARAAQRPDAVAATCDGQTLTYGELEAQANQLARHLLSLGVGPEVLVGLFLDRSLEMLVAILGVLKAGGAYVPMDLAYPRERRAFVQQDARLPVIVTLERLVADLPESDALCLCLDAAWPEISRQSAGRPASRVLPDNLAYVIYTSGSTGRPKGVRVTHGNVTRLFEASEAWYGFGPADVWTLFHSYAFDFSVWELWGALLYGGRLVVVPYWMSRSPEEFYGLLSRERVTVLSQTPSAFRQLIRVEEQESLPLSLRWVVFGGEALEIQSLRPWWERHGDEHPRLVNMYGITETTVHVTYRPLGVADLGRSASVIGVPLPDLEVYLLDRHQRPVPAGVPGELCVGGAGVSRGYLGRPELEAVRLIPHPFSGEPGARLYRSGDLARWLPDGDLEYLGRIDHQVKIRGFRIEIGEIEATLAQHPGVSEAVVLLHEHTADDKRLVSYLVPNGAVAVAARQKLRLEREGALAAHPLYELGNGMPVFYLNKSETEFLFDEIFVAGSYLRHGITLPPGARVFDVGANIGFFTLYCAGQREDVEVFAFEPIPETYETLRLNTELYGVRARLFDCGLADEEKEVEFTYYPHVSVISGYLADPEEEREVVRGFLRSQSEALTEDQIEELLVERLTTRRVSRELRRLSSVIREYGVDRIDLLKVDVEKSELEVLRGLDEEDWPKVRQVVLEVHDVEGRLETVKSLLSGHGFRLTVEQDESLQQTRLYNIYAVRPEDGAAVQEAVDLSVEVPARWWSGSRLVQSVREQARQRLPEYMMPSSWVLLESLPLTSNGKVDRKALPELETGRQEGAGEYLGPRTPTEEVLAGLWSEVLGVERVGVRDSFFDLGGHSLLATQMVSRVRETFAVELELARLFEAPTVEALAERVEAAQREDRGISAPPLTRRERHGPLPLSFAQQRLWFLHQLEPESSAYNIPVAIRVRGSLSRAALEGALAEIVRRHEALRTTFSPGSEGVQQVVSEAAGFLLPTVDLSHLVSEKREAAARRISLAEAESPFDLSRGPLLRALLVRLGAGEHLLLFVMHHIVSDGWSMGVLVSEAAALYRVLAEGAPSGLPELPIQYGDFVLWQREWLRGEVLERQVRFWREELAGVPEVLELPTDHPRPEIRSPRGGTLSFRLDASLSSALAAFNRLESVTLFMTLLAGFFTLLERYSGQEELVVGTPIANRTRPEVEPLIGFFVSTVVLRGRLGGTPTVRELLRRVKRTALEAYAHQDLPFEKLVEELSPERSRSRTPLFQVAFALQNAPFSKIELGNLALEPTALSSGTAKFDLTLALTEEDGEIAGEFEYSSDLFEEPTIARYASHFETLLRG
ncbi:MAG: amino acid adenylation domain-containing protein, partial [Thermoanaerobaculia bacterium]